MNAFENYVATQMTPGRARRVRVVTSEKSAPVVLSPMEKTQREQSVQFSLFRKAKRVEHLGMLTGKHGLNYRALLKVLKTLQMTAQSSADLVTYIRKAAWLLRLDEHQRFTVLSIIDAKIIRMRVLAGMAPFSDTLPGQPPNAFQIIRKIMTGV